jgi:DME family drug/metabolite transporter
MIGEFAALGAAISWAVAPILYRKALSGASPFAANVVRCVTNAAVLFLVLVGSGLLGVLSRLPVEVVVAVVVSGVVGLGVGDTLYMVGLKSVGVARSVPLASTYPLFSLLWAVLLLGQAVTTQALSGAVVILLGIWLLSRERGDSTFHFRGGALAVGVVASLLTAVLWSVSITLMDFAVTMPGVVSGLEANYAVVTVRIAGMALVMLAATPLLDRGRGFLRLGWRTVILLCVAGLVANGLGWLLMNYSFLNIAESQAVPISSTTPLFSAAAGFLFFREKMTLDNTLGAVLVVAGIMLIFFV